MGKDKSSLKYGIVAILFVIAAVFTFVQVTTAQPADQVSRLTAAEPTQDGCRLALEVQGPGAVAARDSSGQERLLTAAADEFSAACGPVELTAVPDPLSKFVSWQGVPAEQQFKYRISVDTAAGITAVFAERQILRYESLDVPYIDRGGQLVTEVPIYESAWRSSRAMTEDNAAPIIDVWYGDTQPFGQIGTPQRWVNILGNVSDADGDLPELEYSLNGGAPVTLTVGGCGELCKGDGLRLYRKGDFNIDLDKADLIDGANTVLITATDAVTASTSLVTVNYDAGNTWPLPYSIDWSGASSLQDVAQVVDGDWGYTAAGVRPQPGQTGYDRIIDLGDMTWTDFEMTVPITVHGFDPNGFGGQQVAPAIALVMRWQGHTATPDLCDQPLCGYLPVGAASWYAFDNPSSEKGQFSMWVTPGAKTFDPTNLSLTWGETYYWKVRSESVPGTKGRFKMKVWPASAGLAGEPADWMVSINGTSNSLQNGSVLLLSHHVDVTFGNVTVVPINAGEGPPDISSIKVIPEPYGATISWLTDEPADSHVDYGKTSAYGSTVASTGSTEHSAYLPGLDPQKEYHFKITATDVDNETSSTPDKLFTTQKLIALVSDDFNACDLAPDWTFFNPLDDGSFELNGSQLEISVPAGTAHDVWPSPGLPIIRAPNLMHPVTDPNNLKVKFDSGIAVDRALQGILVEQDDQNFLRINYQYQDGKLKLFVIGYKAGTSPDIIKNITVNGASSSGPLYLLLTRQVGQWQVGYSTDGGNWSEVGLFTFPLSVTSAGVFVGNYNKTLGSEPAFTAVVDYYFDANAPIDPEDTVPLMLPVQVVGNGSVSKDPICGNPVSLTASADPGWHFVEWRGAPIHGLTSLVVTDVFFESGDEVAAMFEIGEPQKYVLVIQTNGQGTVTKNPDKDEFIAGESVALTAVPADGWLFDSWEGAITGTGPRRSILMDDHKVIKANFIQDQFTVDVTVAGPGQVQVSPQGPYDYGEKVTLTAVPVGKYAAFLGWSGAISGSDNPLEFEITGDTSLTATFIIYRQFLPFTVKASGK